MCADTPGEAVPVLAPLLAPAKINLALHVTGRRADGYHLLDSLVAFTELGDRVQVTPAAETSLIVTGPFADAVPAGADNLCLRALDAVGARAHVVLDKRLPPASGIGGGTADAAAVLRALGRHPAHPEALGADLPACLLSRPLRMRGVGELIQPLPLPVLHLVLVNARVETSTPAVFAALDRRDGDPMAGPVPSADAGSLLRWLETTRNDLQAPALSLRPVVGDCLAALAAQGARFTRMSGSGATCFGVFPTASAAQAAAQAILAASPGWWVQATATLPGLSPAGAPG